MRLNPLKILMNKKGLLQKEIIIITFLILSAFLICWIFIYFPSKNIVKRIKSELAGLQRQIYEIEAVIGRAKTTDKNIRALVEKSQKLNNAFPQKEEESLKMLSQLARNLNIELNSVKPQLRAVFLGEDKKEVKIEGKTCQKIFVSLEMKCFYKDLVKYIETLKKVLPALATVEILKAGKDCSGTTKLNVTLGINLYLLS
ncbi:MAG: hypothetical protein U9R31_03680 [Candidatus Omnitrophota bacterium]|nr:hypothetical protein [Candidatus Omnitrophota bacterium]